jgi:hypothetical protein
MNDRMKFFIIICGIFASLHSALADDASNADLEKRIKTLEKKIARMAPTTVTEDDRSVKSFLDTHVNFGGFFESAITMLSPEDRALQTSTVGNTLGINLGAEFSDNLRFVSQFVSYLSLPVQNQNGDPRGSTVGLPSQAEFKTYTYGTLITQGYLEYSGSEAFNVQMGMGYVPYGITFQQLELVLFVRRGGPQLLSATDLVFPLWEGFHIHGSTSQGPGHFGYDVYSFSDISEPKFPGGGARIWWKSPEENLNLGLSTQVSKRGEETFQALGADIRAKLGRFTVTSEWSKSDGSRTEQPWSAYIEPDYDLYNEVVLLYTFADYLSAPNNTTVGTNGLSLDDPYKKMEYGGGINWLPTSYTRLRLGVTFNDYLGYAVVTNTQTRNYWNLDISAGISF